MEIARIDVTGVRERAIIYRPIPVGMIGGTVRFVFSDHLWDGLTKTIVFQAGDVTKDVLNPGELSPKLKQDGSLVKSGTRINWNGKLKRAAVDLWDTQANNPDNAPTLWEDIAYRDGHRIIPATITAGTAFALDECGWWGDTLYRSKLAANVYTPEQYPAGWEVTA